MQNVWKVKINYLLSLIISSELFLKVLINWRDIKDTEKILWQNQNLVHSWFFILRQLLLQSERNWKKLLKNDLQYFLYFSLFSWGVKHPLKQNRYPALFCCTVFFVIGYQSWKYEVASFGFGRNINLLSDWHHQSWSNHEILCLALLSITIVHCTFFNRVDVKPDNL